MFTNLTLLEVVELLASVKLYLLPNWGHFKSLFFYPILFLFCFLDYYYMHVVLQVAEASFIFFFQFSFLCLLNFIVYSNLSAIDSLGSSILFLIPSSEFLKFQVLCFTVLNFPFEYFYNFCFLTEMLSFYLLNLLQVYFNLLQVLIKYIFNLLQVYYSSNNACKMILC